MARGDLVKERSGLRSAKRKRVPQSPLDARRVPPAASCMLGIAAFVVLVLLVVAMAGLGLI
jgi:hypothetical protein